MSINKYHINSSVRVKATFEVDGVLTDPTTVTLKIMNPAGTVTAYTAIPADITKASTGIYYKDIPSTSMGEWWYEWTGTGAVVAADESHYIINHSRFA